MGLTDLFKGLGAWVPYRCFRVWVVFFWTLISNLGLGRAEAGQRTGDLFCENGLVAGWGP